jgi:hypothetical protein
VAGREADEPEGVLVVAGRVPTGCEGGGLLAERVEGDLGKLLRAAGVTRVAPTSISSTRRGRGILSLSSAGMGVSGVRVRSSGGAGGSSSFSSFSFPKDDITEAIVSSEGEPPGSSSGVGSSGMVSSSDASKRRSLSRGSSSGGVVIKFRVWT